MNPIYLLNLSCKKTRRKNNWYFGLCPVLPLLRFFWGLVGPCLVCWDYWPSCEEFVVSLAICLSSWVVSCPPNWKEFNIEFRTPVNNIVSLFTGKIEIFLDLICEANLCSLSFGSSYGWVLHTSHVWKEYLGMKLFVCENPLRRWKPLRRFWMSSPNFFVKDVKWLEWLGDEKDKIEKYIWGALCIFVQVNIIVFTAWGEMMIHVLSFISSSFSFSLWVFIFTWSSLTSLGMRGFNIILCPWKLKEILLVWPSRKILLSYCQGLSNRICVASIGTTSHKTSSSYFPMEKVMRTCLLTIISPFSLSYCSL